MNSCILICRNPIFKYRKKIYVKIHAVCEYVHAHTPHTFPSRSLKGLGCHNVAVKMNTFIIHVLASKYRP